MIPHKLYTKKQTFPKNFNHVHDILKYVNPSKNEREISAIPIFFLTYILKNVKMELRLQLIERKFVMTTHKNRIYY